MKAQIDRVGGRKGAREEGRGMERERRQRVKVFFVVNAVRVKTSLYKLFS